MSDDISKSEFADWKNQEVTQKIFTRLQDVRKITEEHLMYGGTVGDHTAQETARAVGLIRGLDMLLGMDSSN